MGRKVKRWPTERIGIEKLLPADYNPRRMDRESAEALRASVTRFGMVEWIVWNKRSGRLVSGHQRLDLLRSLGEDSADCIVVDLGDADEKALNLALNSPKLRGEFDDARLAALVDELRASSPQASEELRLSELCKGMGMGGGQRKGTRETSPPTSKNVGTYWHRYGAVRRNINGRRKDRSAIRSDLRGHRE
ncbi:MAG: ParB N-terminal domain-containing protein [Bryobacteraceae bacterium]